MDKLFNKLDKFLMAIIWLILGILIGFLVRLFSFPTTFSSLESIAIQYLPWGFGFGLIFSAFGYFSPKVSSFILEMILGIEFGKDS